MRTRSWPWLGLVALPLLAGCPPGQDDDDDTGNWPPTAAQVEIEPAAPEAGEALTAFLVGESWDPDGDEVSYRIAWLRDGQLQEAWTGPSVDPGVTGAGETWRVVITPTDGRHDGPASGDVVTVGGGGDDDAGDDDAGDDDAGDDDAGDDDTSWPEDPWAFYQEATIGAVGGPQGGSAEVVVTWPILDDLQNEICAIEWQFEADVVYGPGQGPDFWPFIDETVTWTTGGEAANSCPQPFEQLFGADPWTMFAWVYHPMAFVSCEQVASNAALGDTFLGDDPMQLAPAEGTFEAWCQDGGPLYASALGTGPLEGIWLMGGYEGTLDGVGQFGYFHPDDQTNVDSWMYLGLLMADAANPYEPGPGLDGLYLTVPVWLWLF